MRKVLAVLVFATLSGCFAYANSTPGVGVAPLKFDKPLHYELLGDAQGKGCVYTILGIPINADRAGTISTGGHTNMMRLLLSGGGAKGAATYNAIEAFNGADFILPVRTKTEASNYVVYSSACTTVTGKAIRIKK